ncbi:MAG TPA: tetratricopeptide repeat protein [Longimicrobium sp.]|nr:tetratricopeptide repeat protein [Longimicrobium sp.]
MNEPSDRPSGFFHELKRRHVVRVGLAYAGAAFVLLQGVQLMVEASFFSPQTFRTLVVVAIVGFPIALLLGWFFDLTPEGVRLAGGEGSAGRLIARLKPRAVLLGGIAAVLAALVGLAVWRRPDASAAALSGEVVAEGEAIAILPFATSGDGVGTLEQGLVDLLSRSLNGVGEIRVADPRAVLARWKEFMADGQATMDEKLAIAAETNATSFLTGSVVAVQKKVRINADLVGLDGQRLASVQVDGSDGDLLGLVDSLSVAVLREILRSSRPLPEIDVSAITSSNMDALRAFLAGERYYRASAWDQAMASFTTAVERDTLFALGYYRLAGSAGWGGSEDVRARALDRATQLLPRLPAREQILVRAEALRRAGNRAAAIDTMSAYLERYPDDPEATFLMADDLYHLQNETAPLTSKPAEDALWLFDRTLSLDPSFTPALIHPLEVAFRTGDVEVARRYVRTLEKARSVDREAVAVYRIALAALSQPADGDVVRAAITRAVEARRTASRDLVWQARRTVLDPLLRLAVALPEPERRAVAEVLRSAPSSATEQGAATRALFDLLLAEGKLDDARDVLRRAAVQRTIDRVSLTQLSYFPVLLGYTTEPLLTSPEFPAPAAAQAAALMLRAVERGDATALRQALPQVQAAPVNDTTLRTVMVRAGQGFARVLEGDTVAGLREVESALDAAGFRPSNVLESLWLQWLASAALHPSTRDRALAILERPWPGRTVLDVRRRFALARGLEAAGRAQDAAPHYRAYTAALSASAPSLRADTRLQHARSALQRTPAQ